MYPPVSGSAHVAYGLFKQFRTLEGVCGIADSAALATAEGVLTFKVLGDGKLLWQSEAVSSRGTGMKFQVDVTGITKLELVVENSESLNDGCHAVWCEPRLWPIALAPPVVK